MFKKSAPKSIRLRGVRHNNLKNFDLDLPLGKLIVVTGLSGSGKSSLAFDTLFAEGQRRYIETFSPYARQFLDRMDKPQVDSIENIPPAIAIEQRNTVKSTRSTVGTMTEICDYGKLLWSHLARLHCRNCGQLVQKDSPRHVWESVARGTDDILITFEVPLSEKLSLQDSLALISKQGYQRLLIGREIARIDDALEPLLEKKPTAITIVQDRIKTTDANRKRFVEACEQAYHFGKGKLAVRELGAAAPRFFSNRLHCAHCDIEYREPSPALFSFNHPLGACPTCRGFGRTITIDYNLALPDKSKTLADGVVRPWQTGQGAESQQDLLRFCKLRKVPTNISFNKLPQKFQDWLIEGDPGYGSDSAHEWPKAWYGVKGYFRWLESKSYKMHVRVLLSRYRSYRICTDCHGTRFQPEALGFTISRSNTSSNTDKKSALNISDFYQLSIHDALQFVDSLSSQRKQRNPSDPLTLALKEVQMRLQFLDEVGLGYLTLDRATRTLSGGETERVNLTTCLGSGLVNTLFVLDEPSVGLHSRDTDRLIQIVQRLRDTGNTVLVVEHEASMMRAADQIVDLGPGHGESGGELVFQGTYGEILKSKASLTGQYLSDRKSIEIPERRPVGAQTPQLTISNASIHNLKNISMQIPLGRFVCITGVSGSGKTTLIREVLLPKLEANLESKDAGNELATDAANGDSENGADSDEPEIAGAPSIIELSGWENIGRVVLVDQSPLGKTPRSNPAVYIGAFDEIREIFAQTDLAKQRGLNASAFSFNSAQGQCERCRGAGFEKIEMQFLSDVFIRCPECNGRRYRSHILEVNLAPSSAPKSDLLSRNSKSDKAADAKNIADVLESSVDEAIAFLRLFAESRHAIRAEGKLKLLQEVGLGYLRLGQAINTLSGGESQRLKLVSHLTEVEIRDLKADGGKPTLFLFDEPTTGLHFEDVRVLLKVFQRIVDAGHSVFVIEHNLDVIKSADWVVDLGPDAGAGGGEIVAEGSPELVSTCRKSHTGLALRTALNPKRK